MKKHYSHITLVMTLFMLRRVRNCRRYYYYYYYYLKQYMEAEELDGQTSKEDLFGLHQGRYEEFWPHGYSGPSGPLLHMEGTKLPSTSTSWLW